MSYDFEQGEVLLFDKPYTWTSFDVVGKTRNAIRRALGKKVKVGHAGTLDPLATGLLIICTGRMTKKIDEYQAQEKEYTGTITLGGTTPCYDLEKPVDQFFPTDHISDEMIYGTAQSLSGSYEQEPPLFSAVKIEGKRAYDIARAGQTAEIKKRLISVPVFEITGIEMPNVHFRIVCSKGTYIRSIARDFGLKLNSGAHLSALRRTRIGQFSVEDAMTPAEFLDKIAPQAI